MRAADADRRRLERELHGGLQQTLVALAVEFQLVRQLGADYPAALKTRLEGLHDATQEALDEATRLAERIYPPLLEAGGLAAALRATATSGRVKALIEVDGVADLPPDVAGAVYFSCLGVLEEVPEGGTVAVTVQGNGSAVAFELVVEAEHDVAISNAIQERLRDRLEALGGRLTIEPGDAGSTAVAGCLPISR